MPRAERSHVRLELEVLPNDTYDESKEAYIPAISIYLNGDIPFNSLNESTINNILEKMRASLYKQLKDGVSNELMLRAVRRFTPKRQWRRLYSEYNLTLPVELEKEVIEEEEKANRKYTVRAEGGWEIDGPIFDEADEIHIIPAEPQRPDHRVVPDQPQVRVEPYRRGAAIRPS